MALNDAQYQINDLKAQVKSLQNQMRASLPGNRPSAGPDHPLAAITSIGQSVPGGGDSDFRSRALTTAVENALGGVESLQDVVTSSVGVRFGTGVTQSLHQTNYLRPDPIAGDVYRIFAAGSLSELDAIGAQAFDFQFRISGGTAHSMGTLLTGDNQTHWWQLLLHVVVASAGPTSSCLMTSRLVNSNTIVLLAPAGIFQEFLFANTIIENLVAPIFELQVVASSATDDLDVTLNTYLLERLGSSGPNAL